MNDTITLPRSVVEQALKALEKADRISGYRNNWAAVNSLIAALEQQQESPYGECDECGTEYSFDPTDGGSICVACLKERLKQPQDEQEPAGEKTQPEIDHAHELRRHSRKLGEPVGETAGVMQRAADEIERLRTMLAAASQPKLYPLPDDLYGGSKDWRAGSYAERVEWLHLMYEGAKEEIERLGQTQGEQEPFTVLVRKRSWFKNTWEAAPCGFPDYGKAWADERINVYTHPQNLNCKSTQHRLATLWGYEKPQLPRQPLTEMEIVELRQLTPGTLDVQFVKFARAIEAAHGIKEQK